MRLPVAGRVETGAETKKLNEHVDIEGDTTVHEQAFCYVRWMFSHLENMEATAAALQASKQKSG